MLKKYISLILIICMIVTMIACGNNHTNSNDDSERNTATDQEQHNNESEGNKKVKDNTLWKRKMVAITIDDGPKDCTEKLLNGLKDKDAKVTFFLLGENIDLRPDLVKRMVAEGHTIGWHSYNHNISKTSSESEVEESFRLAQQTLDKHQIDYKFHFYRNPGGHQSEAITKYAIEYGFSTFAWSNGSFNDKLPTAQQMCDSTFDGIITNGSVLLIHDYNENVVDGILLLVDSLLDEGYEVVNLDELMKRRNGGVAGERYGENPIY